MVFFMGIGVQTLKFVPLLVAAITEEEIITVLAHPTTFVYEFLAVKTFIFLLFVY